jgi:hypothetical protein
MRYKRLELPPSALWAVIDYLYEPELENYCDWVAAGKNPWRKSRCARERLLLRWSLRCGSRSIR